jgi:hypothetical protein
LQASRILTACSFDCQGKLLRAKMPI